MRVRGLLSVSVSEQLFVSPAERLRRLLVPRARMRGRGLLSVSVSEQLFVSPAEKEKEKSAETVGP
jgi:hypothetical protein